MTAGMSASSVVKQQVQNSNPKPRCQVHELKFRMSAADLLGLAKQDHTFRELAKMTTLPETVLSRYCEGHLLPGMKRAEELVQQLQGIIRLDTRILRLIKFDGSGRFNNTKIITDLTILELASQQAMNLFMKEQISKVLTPAVDGIPLATTLASKLGVDVVVAKKEREIGVPNFYESEYEPPGSGIIVRLYVPRGAIKNRDNVLIVDDVIDSCETYTALHEIVKKARANLVGAFMLITVGSEWRTWSDRCKCRVESIVQLPKKNS